LSPGIIGGRRSHITLLIPSSLLLSLGLPGSSTSSLIGFGTLLFARTTEEKNGTNQNHHCDYQAGDDKNVG